MSNHRPTRIETGTWTTSLSLVVALEDGFTGKSPVRGPEVRLEGVGTEPVTTPSGYQVFLDLPPDPATVVVDGGNRFLDERRENVDVIDLSDPNTDVDPTDPESLPVETVVLRPAPAYRFPSGATVVRGVVRTASDEPVSDAMVSIDGLDLAVETTAGGEFVLFVDIEDDDVSVHVNETVTVAGDSPTVGISHPTHGKLSEPISLAEGDLVTTKLRYS